jgi:tungstate transport system substrate-binding protein
LLRRLLTVGFLGTVAIFIVACGGDDHQVILATTTSTENSGLLDVLIPLYEGDSGDSVKVISVGSGAAISMGERGDTDVLLVHSPAAELAFVDAGFGIERARVMFNDFIIVGPTEDPSGIGHMSDATEAFAAIKVHGARFISRGDESGTHVKEKTLWDAAGLDVPSNDEWYIESGQGMAATLTIAAETGAYTLTDRATWLSVSDPERLPILVEGDERLFNVYHVVLVNPELHSIVNSEAARRFRAFLLEPATQQLIGEFGGEQYGQPLFTPYASESD